MSKYLKHFDEAKKQTQEANFYHKLATQSFATSYMFLDINKRWMYSSYDAQPRSAMTA